MQRNNMNTNHIFSIKPDENYYSTLFIIERNETIGRPWMILFLGFMFFIVTIFLLIGLFIGEAFPGYIVYIGVFVFGFYLYRNYKASLSLKQDYRANVPKKPKDIKITISEDKFIVYEDHVKIANSWNDFNGIQAYHNSLLIGYSDGKVVLLDHNQLPVEQKRQIIALVESKFTRKKTFNISNYITASFMAIAGTAFGIMFIYNIYDLIIDPKSMAKIIVISILSLFIFGLSFSSFFLMKRAWKSRHE